MTIKQVISFWGVPVFTGILGSLPIEATAAELSFTGGGGADYSCEADVNKDRKIVNG
ncbi:MAG: hypothetical protein ACXWMV_09260 [Syntrophales bacterium]